MKILVLGGTGAMGIPVVDILAERGNDVYVTTRRERISSKENIHYITGNAQKDVFLTELLKKQFDVLIDFMIYAPGQFGERLELMLGNVDQYFFFSSSRVYADAGDKRITEESPRLLDVIQDEEYLNTDEYALAKAREEDLLRGSAHHNWTVIRPYITYNDERLQLGVFEKEMWLQRALNGKAIVFQKDIASKYTTLTYGYDVSLRIADLVGKAEALGEVFQITTNRFIKWADVLDIYLDVLEKELGKRPEVVWVDDSSRLNSIINPDQVRYDRLYDRKFDNSKIQRVSGEGEGFIAPGQGLAKCFENFIRGNKQFKSRGWKAEAVLDRITGEKSKIKDIPGWKNKMKYVFFRYFKTA